MLSLLHWQCPPIYCQQFTFQKLNPWEITVLFRPPFTPIPLAPLPPSPHLDISLSSQTFTTLDQANYKKRESSNFFNPKSSISIVDGINRLVPDCQRFAVVNGTCFRLICTSNSWLTLKEQYPLDLFLKLPFEPDISIPIYSGALIRKTN